MTDDDLERWEKRLSLGENLTHGAQMILVALAKEVKRLLNERDDARTAARMLRTTLLKIDEERGRDDLRISAALAEIEPFYEWLREAK